MQTKKSKIKILFQLKKNGEMEWLTIKTGLQHERLNGTNQKLA